MSLFILMVALASLSFALALPSDLEIPHGKQQLTIVYHNVNNSVLVEALSSDLGLLGRACSASLSSGIFGNLPVTFDVDERGSGHLTVGASTYRIHEDVEHSGGITCGRMFNAVEAAVSCAVNVPAELPLQPLGEPDTTECIPNASSRVLPEPFKLIGAVSRAAHCLTLNNTKPNQIVARQSSDSGCGESGTTELVGQGYPQQDYFHFQLSVSDGWGGGSFHNILFQRADILLTWV
jgi:hypothetical protein